MPDFHATDDQTTGTSSILVGNTPRQPITLDKWIQTALTVGGENDLRAVLIDIAAQVATSHTTEGSIRSDIFDIAEYQRWQGDYDDAAAYVANDEIKSTDGNYYRARQPVAAGGGAPTATTADWLLLAGLELEIAQFHEYLHTNRSKINEDDWGSLPVGHQFRVGDFVKRFEQWFVCEVEHVKGGTGPDNDPDNWSPVTNFAGEYDTTKYYHKGIYVEYRGRLAFALQDIVPNDPAPDHYTNSKWWYPPNDAGFAPWKYSEPSGGVPDLEIDSAAANNGVVEHITDTLDADQRLVHAIREAQAAGIKTELRIAGTFKYFFKQNPPLVNTSGAILQVDVWLGATPRAIATKYLERLDHNTTVLADFRNSNGGRDAYGTNPDLTKEFSLIFNETHFAEWNLQEGEVLNFILLGGSVNGSASVKMEIDDVAISYDRTNEDLDSFRQEIIDLLAAYAQHQEVVVHELPDPASVTAPEYAYLSRIWRPTQGFAGNQGIVEYSPGEYQRTTGTANRAKVVFGAGTYADGNNVRNIRGFIQRGERLRVGSAHYLSDVGEALHNPVGGALAGIFWTRDPSNIFTSANSWVMWVKNSLASRKPPWNIQTNVEQGGLHVRIYYDSTHVDINFAHGGQFETIDGIEYQYYYAQDATGATWINALDLSDTDASTVEIEFRRNTDNQLYWLGDEAEGWTWIDPDSNPTAVSRIDRIELGSLVQGTLLASITRVGAGSGQLTDQDWTIPAGVSGVTKQNTHPTGNWTRYLHIDPDVYCKTLSGSHGLLIVVERGGSIISSSFLPFTTAHASWVDADQIFVGKWNTGASQANTLYGGWGANAGLLHLTLACSGADNQSTVKIYRTN